MLTLAGLSHTPRSEKAEVSFSVREVETYLPYAKSLREFLAKYDDEPQKDQMKYEDCGSRFHTDVPSALLASLLENSTAEQLCSET